MNLSCKEIVAGESRGYCIFDWRERGRRRQREGGGRGKGEEGKGREKEGEGKGRERGKEGGGGGKGEGRGKWEGERDGRKEEGGRNSMTCQAHYFACTDWGLAAGPPSRKSSPSLSPSHPYRLVGLKNTPSARRSRVDGCSSPWWLGVSGPVPGCSAQRSSLGTQGRVPTQTGKLPLPRIRCVC